MNLRPFHDTFTTFKTKVKFIFKKVSNLSVKTIKIKFKT